MTADTHVYEQNYSKLVDLVKDLRIADACGKLLYSSRSTLVRGDLYFVGFNPGGNPEIEDIKIIDHLKETPEVGWTEFTHAEWFSHKKRREPGQTSRQKRVINLFQSLGLNIENIFLTNAVFARAPDEQQTRAHPLYASYLSDSSIIHGLLIDIIRPRVIVAFGSQAKKAFLSHEKSAGFADQTKLSSLNGDYVVVEIPHFSFRRGDDEFLKNALSVVLPHLRERNTSILRDTPTSNYPIAIIQDRYGGVYSKGRWLAISIATHMENGAYRIVRCLEDNGPHGDDTDAMMFWADPPNWVAAGDTPNEAVEALLRKRTIRGPDDTHEV